MFQMENSGPALNYENHGRDTVSLNSSRFHFWPPTTDTVTVVVAASRCRFLIIHCETDGEQGDISIEQRCLQPQRRTQTQWRLCVATSLHHKMSR